MLYVTTIQVLSTAIIGAIAVFVAWRQWSISHHRLVLDLLTADSRIKNWPEQ
jgi:hypothetical protein